MENGSVSKPVLAVDLDEVLCRFLPKLVEWWNVDHDEVNLEDFGFL